MFKGKSPLGKENLMNEWFGNDQMKLGLSPVKNQSSHFEHSFANVRKGRHNYPERNQPAPNSDLLRRLSDPLDLQCNETLQFYPEEVSGGGQTHPQIETNLYCEQQLEPIQGDSDSSLQIYLLRLQSMLDLYMKNDIENRNRIRELEAELQQKSTWNNEIQRQRVFYRK